jgi:hypothetical protein
MSSEPVHDAMLAERIYVELDDFASWRGNRLLFEIDCEAIAFAGAASLNNDRRFSRRA